MKQHLSLIEDVQNDLDHFWYFVFHALFNILLITVYLVQVVIDYPPCLSATGVDIEAKFSFALILGIVIISADILNSNCFVVYFRYSAMLERQFINVVGIVIENEKRDAEK